MRGDIKVSLSLVEAIRLAGLLHSERRILDILFRADEETQAVTAMRAELDEVRRAVSAELDLIVLPQLEEAIHARTR